MDGYYNLSLKRPETAEEAKNNCIATKNWNGGAKESLSQEEKATRDAANEIACAGPWVKDENGNWKQQPPVVITTSTSAPTTATAGFGDNKMLIYLVAAGAILWYMNKEGYLKKILK
jgi:hypothetical protein|tara:strand:- start:495 stop:845 length:351 start_codon:yes stop_codon:yes gene_type:complete